MKRIFCLFLMLGVVSAINANEKDKSKALEILSYYGKYVVESKRPGLPADSLSAAILEQWPEVKPKKKYKIGILLPASNTPYWRSIHYSMTEQARKLDLDFVVMEAGGYEQIDKQMAQLMSAMVEEKVEGVILASLSYYRMDQTIDDVQKKHHIPVIAVGNDVYAPSIQGKVLSSFQLAGKQVCEYIIEKQDFNPVNLAFLPGPKGSGWAEDTMQGFEDCLQAYFQDHKEKAGKVRVMAEYYGPMIHPAQAKLAESLLTKKKEIDFLIGNAVASLEAARLYKNNQKIKENNPDLKLISTYNIPAVYDQIRDGLIDATVSDRPLVIGQVAVDMLVRVLNGEQSTDEPPKLPFRVSPVLSIIDKSAIKTTSYESIFGPRDLALVFRHPPPPLPVKITKKP